MMEESAKDFPTTDDGEKLLDAKVFLELWVKVRSGWADDEAHLRSYGYE